MAGGPSLTETKIGIIDALQGQQAQLKRLLAQETFEFNNLAFYLEQIGTSGSVDQSGFLRSLIGSSKAA